MFVDIPNPLNDSQLVFPVLECLHILGFTMALGTIALVDFRLLGLGLRRQTPAELGKAFAPWTLIGLASVLISGPLLYSSDPDMYYLNRPFQIKIACLAVAIVFNYTIHRKAVASSSGGKLVACISLTLWASVIAGGIFIAFA